MTRPKRHAVYRLRTSILVLNGRGVNALKSNIICYGPKCTDLNIELHVVSISIQCVDRVKYLGVYLMSAKSFKVCWHEPKKKFFRPPTSPTEIAFSASTK